MRTYFSALRVKQIRWAYPVFLNGYICEVNKHIVQLTDISIILHSAKPSKSQPVPEK